MPGSVALGVIVSIAVGCGPAEEPAREVEGEQPPTAAAAETPPAAGADAASAEAREIFETRCAVCHGPQGTGDGPGSAALDPKPRDFRSAEWQESVSDDHIANIVKFGGAAVGRSPTMPGNPDLISKPSVVNALVAHIRSLRQD